MFLNKTEKVIPLFKNEIARGEDVGKLDMIDIDQFKIISVGVFLRSGVDAFS